MPTNIENNDSETGTFKMHSNPQEGNSRTIALISHPRNVSLRILQQRPLPCMEHEMQDA